MWRRLVVLGPPTRKEFQEKSFHAAMKLTRVLDDAMIPEGIDVAELPSLAAAAERRDTQIPRTGPYITAHVRNMIVHQTGYENELYGMDDDLLVESWMLSQHYLVLLLLHHLGYQGSYQRQLQPGGWAGDVESVPWASAQS